MVGKRVLSILGILSAIAAFGFAGAAQAQKVIGVPHDWQLNFPAAFTPIMERVESLHDLLLVIIIMISIFVLILLIYAVWRFHASRNPVATNVTHHTGLEIAWTIIPILILVVVAVPSFRLLYYSDKAIDAGLTVKVTGHQWKWEYEYFGEGIRFMSNTSTPKEQIEGTQPKGEHYLLEVDRPLVVPAGKKIRLVATASDVIHS